MGLDVDGHDLFVEADGNDGAERSVHRGAHRELFPRDELGQKGHRRRELIHARAEPPEKVSFSTFRQDRNLAMIPTEKSLQLSRSFSTRKDRARDEAVVAKVKLSLRHLVERCSEPRPNESRIANRGPCERDDSSWIEPARFEELSDCYDVLASHVPDDLASVHRVEPMDVHSDRSGGMWTLKLFVPQPFVALHWYRAPCRGANVDRPIGELQKRCQATLEVAMGALQHALDVRGKRIRIHRRDENRVRLCLRIRDAPEGSCSEGRPKT